MKRNIKQTDFKYFSGLCKALYEPLLEKQGEILDAKISETIRQYTSRGFNTPPGAMYADISTCYKDDLQIRADLIFKSCCQAYRGSIRRPRIEEFTKELTEAISIEQERILASGKGNYEQYHIQFKILNYEHLVKQYNTEVLAEGRRLSRYYSSRVELFIAEAMASDRADNPLELKPNVYGIGIDLKKIIPWFKNKFNK